MTTTVNAIGQDTAEQLVALREKWHTKNHPFFVDFYNGKFGLGPVGAMMAQHFHHARLGLPALGIVYSKGAIEDRLAILENVAEEEGLMAGPGDGRHAVNHAETILRFCRFTGLTDEQVLATPQLPSWQARSYFFLTVVHNEPFAVIMAVQATQEGQQPAINSERMLPGFAKHHGLQRDNPVIEFFAEHELADADHSSRSLELIKKLITNDDLRRRALTVAQVQVRTRWACMSEIYRTAVLGEKDPLPPGVA
jgi:pyrroloquinoline quinone (PQQ) biosynthesis protein C